MAYAGFVGIRFSVLWFEPFERLKRVERVALLGKMHVDAHPAVWSCGVALTRNIFGEKCITRPERRYRPIA